MAFVAMNFYCFSYIWKVEGSSFKSTIRNSVQLSPLLFVIYMNDIKNLELTGNMYMYTDDISIFYPYKYEDAVKAYVDRDVALIVEYMRISKLFLNPDKTKLIRFRPVVRFNLNFSIHIDGKEIVLN